MIIEALDINSTSFHLKPWPFCFPSCFWLFRSPVFYSSGFCGITIWESYWWITKTFWVS